MWLSLGECFPYVFGARRCFIFDAQAVQEEQLFCLDCLALKIEALQFFEASGNHLPNDTQDLNTLLWLTDVSKQLPSISLSLWVLCRNWIEWICNGEVVSSHFMHPRTVITNLISGLYWYFVLMIETKCYRDIVILTRSDRLQSKFYLNRNQISQITGKEGSSHKTKTKNIFNWWSLRFQLGLLGIVYVCRNEGNKY